MFVGGYTVFTLSERPTERMFDRVSVSDVIDGISSNFADTFICTRQIFLIKNKG